MFSEKKKKINKKIVRLTGAVLACSVALINFSYPARQFRNLPETVFIDGGTENQLPEIFEFDFTEYNKQNALSAALSQSESLEKGKISLKLFDSLVLREIPVYADKRAELYPGGDIIGISIKTKGVLIVGSGSFINADGKKRCPMQDAGLKPGDIILSLGGRGITTSEQLQSAVNAFRTGADITVEREGKMHTFRIVPEICENGSAMIGAWVRDSAVGIGTLSFIEKDTGRAAALGHAVVDADTGKIIKVRGGRMTLAKIFGILKGEAGEPGELQGTFFSSSEYIGSIENNTDFGIYGRADEAQLKMISMQTQALPIAFPDEVHKGGAYIISAADGGIRKYGCRIIRAVPQKTPEPKSLVIEITDERLINAAGGIVQGMSGSPIIQDGRLAGVVTHVFINDPKRGYGVYAYWMYKIMNENANAGY